MKLFWGILLSTTLLTQEIYGGRIVPINTSPLRKRVGPFFNQRRVYNHPYQEDHNLRGHPAEVQEQPRWPQQLPSQQISERKLLMPIISEGYASTKIQGGHSPPKQKTEKIQMKANVIEQATVQELPSTTAKTRSSTTPPPIPTSATGDVGLGPSGPSEPLSSPYFLTYQI